MLYPTQFHKILHLIFLICRFETAQENIKIRLQLLLGKTLVKFILITVTTSLIKKDKTCIKQIKLAELSIQFSFACLYNKLLTVCITKEVVMKKSALLPENKIKHK